MNKIKSSGLIALCTAAVAASACGGDTNQGTTTSAGTDATGLTSMTGQTSADPTTDSDSATGTTSASSGASDSASSGATTAPSTSSASASASDSDSTGDDTVGTKFDLPPHPDGGVGDCLPGDGDPEFSYLWAANSSQGTISKIDTVTVQEVGRFYVRPDNSGSPSRTSVSLTGHVAVASRSGGLTKIYAIEDLCQDTNGTPGIQTSTDVNPLAWDQEECRAWHIPFTYSSQRPVAWAPGDWNEGTCGWENEMVWTAGRYGTNQDEVVLVDGEAGVIIDMVAIPGLKADSFGIYGAAVDSAGNFWGTGWASGDHLVRVEKANMAVTVWDGPSSTGKTGHWYGMTVDVDGHVWNCSDRAARFDPMTEMWTVSEPLGSWNAGCMADAVETGMGGILWMGSSAPTGITGIDRDTLLQVKQWPTPSSYGVSIDFEGNVWAVNGNGAHKVDPDTGTVTSYLGLVGAYTYSDMTGAALSAVGGGPSG